MMGHGTFGSRKKLGSLSFDSPGEAAAGKEASQLQKRPTLKLWSHRCDSVHPVEVVAYYPTHTFQNQLVRYGRMALESQVETGIVPWKPVEVVKII